ncbi:hypothetical protein [Reichenbachiella versicolor]|uniref:hypothetical protein n=1 Tax=Reichenbachiella versicolor TaxID=1821036 RepID=UPI000D6E18F8|nr:hypothetical protein [Reichenbachiella versicolor]
MSRSRKKTKIQGLASTNSEKEDKRDANRKFRRKTKQEVKNGRESLSELREVSNVFLFQYEIDKNHNYND